MESTTQPNSSHTLSTSQETWRMETEARHWIKTFHEKKEKVGLISASGWWNGVISDIEKRRGKKAADDLRRKMNELRRVHG